MPGSPHTRLTAPTAYSASSACDPASSQSPSASITAPGISGAISEWLSLGDSGKVERMRYMTAVGRLRTVAEACHRWGSIQDGLTEARLTAAYAYGPVLEEPGLDLEFVHVALVIDLPADELPWGAEPPQCSSLAAVLRLDKAPVLWRFRPSERPVWNHAIHRPLPIWTTLGGVQSEALDSLAELRAEPFRLPEPGMTELVDQTERELEASSAHLRAVRDRYWDDIAWRRAHRGDGRYPENYLWDAVDGYLDLLDARRPEAGTA